MKQDKIVLQQFRFYHDQYVKLLDPFQWTGLFFVVFMLWARVDQEKLLQWMAVVVCGYIFFAIYNHVYLKSQLKKGIVNRKAKLIFILLCAYGASSWALCGYYVLDLSSPVDVAYSVVTSSMLIAAPALSMNYFPAYAAWNICHSTLAAILYYSIGYPAFAALIIFLSITYLYFSRRSTATQYENLELVERLFDEKQKAEKANAAKSRFLAAASHDLRQPLHSVGLFMSVLSRHFINDEQRRLGKKLEESVAALTNLFNAILDISKLDAGVIETDIKVINLDDIFEPIKADFSPLAEVKGIDLQIIPSGFGVTTDKLLLERILRNLVSNAVRYTANGQVRIEAGLEHNVNGEDVVCVSVLDTGIGIPEDKLEDIFEEFTQLENNARDRRKGLGLGLSIVKRLSETLALDFSIDSRDGEGTQFKLYLPYSDVLPEEAVSRSAEAELFTARGDVVYVIEDEPDIRDGYIELLSDWGYYIQMFAGVNELEHDDALSDDEPVAIIADYRLENNRSGVEAVDIIRAHFNKHIPAVIVTGDTDPEQLKSLSATGFTVLHKPVSLAKLRSFLANMVRRKNFSPSYSRD